MPLYEVELDGSKSEGGHPEYNEQERSGTITVDAKDEAAAKEFAEAQNPGLTATGAKTIQ